MTTAPGYPVEWEADVVLSDGGTVRVRPVRPDDVELIASFHERQSPESIYFRFFSPRPRLTSSDLERFTHVDYVDRMAFIGVLGDDLIGVARYDRLVTRTDAEVAFFVDDAHHGRGLATVLLEYLAARAREVGIAAFTAQVLPTNRKMLGVFKQAGFEVASRFEDGVIEVSFPIEPTDEALAAMEARAARAEGRSVARLLAPRSVAVVGASRRPGTIGHAVFHQLLDHNFEGPVYPVNTESPHVGGVTAYRSVLDIPDEVDLAVVVVPAEQVLGVVRQCARRRVHSLVVLSAGFREAGPSGRALEDEVVALAHRHGMRLLGPNSMGVVNTDPAVRLHASIAVAPVRPGRVGFGSQSGTIGAAVLRRLCELDLGVSTFVATGNKADVSGNDLLQYWEDDPRTGVVVLYLESFGNPRNFGRIARRLGKHKPIVVVKSGRTLPQRDDPPARGDHVPAGWPADRAVDAFLHQTGVVRVDTLDQLFDVTRLLVNQPLPAGPRVAVLSNFWGPALLAVDAVLAAGLQLATPDPGAQEALEASLLAGTRLGNPVELTADAGPDEYGTALRCLLADPGVDSVIAVHAPPLGGRTDDVARAVVAATSDDPTKPVVAAFLGDHDPATFRSGDRAVPVFTFPEAAAHALGRVTRYAQWRAMPLGAVPELADTHPHAARSLARGWLDSARAASAADGAGDPHGLRLDPHRAVELLATHGLRPLPFRTALTSEEAVEAARSIGYPVALKASGLARPSKTEAGGVALDVHGDDEVAAAFERLHALHGEALLPAVVQCMSASAADLRVEAHQHPSFGSVLTVGPGGSVPVDTEPDDTLRIVPLTDRGAERALAESRVGPAVADLGPGAVAAVVDLLLRLSALVDAVPEIASLRADPVLITPDGVSLTDVRIRLAPWDGRPEPPVRKL